jgi:hypothetical protein
MSESELDRLQSAPRDLRIVYLQGFFEKSAKVSAKDRIVLLPVSSLYLLNVIRLLRELDVATHIFGTDPISIAVSASDAARVPLFNPETKSRKYRQVVSLAAKQGASTGPVS